MARKGKPVMCIETGRVFGTAKEAAQWLGTNPSCVSSVLVGYSKTAGGYRWEYVDVEKEEKTVAKPRSRPTMTISEMQREAERRTRETGRFTRYADLQKEETLLMLRRQAARETLKKRKEGTRCPRKH
jgi:hypothetical protein